MPAKPPIVLIHGLWMNPLSWERWVERYRDRGHEVLAPAWPGLDRDVEDLRADPSGLEHLGVAEIVDHYEEIVRGLAAAPIIMGHSFGGLFTQLLLDRGLGVAGVAIDSAAAKGVFTLPPSELRSAFPVLKSPLNNHRAVLLTPEEFHYAFTNTMSEEESRAVYDRYAVPGPGRVLFQGALANFNPRAETRVHYRNDDRAPLLFIAGGADHVIPAAVDEAQAGKYRRSEAVTEFREFPGRSHFTIGQDGWEEVADYALDWAVGHSREPAGGGAQPRGRSHPRRIHGSPRMPATATGPTVHRTRPKERVMRLTTRLNVIDGQVCCPRSGRWQDAERCVSCRELKRFEGDRRVETVVCRPEIHELRRAIESMMRGTPHQTRR